MCFTDGDYAHIWEVVSQNLIQELVGTLMQKHHSFIVR